MARYLVISSQVAHGHVGLSAIVPALHALGHEVIALPTVLLSNHPGHAHVAGERVAPELLNRMLAALAANHRLDDIDAVLTGYLPTVEHVRFAAAAVDRVRHLRPGVPYFCDPVLGDDPNGLYIDAAAAQAIRTTLLPPAQTILPNRFELTWLSGHPVTDADSAVTAARALGSGRVIATSIPGADDTVLTMQIDAAIRLCRVPRRDRVPHGTGDLLSALLVAGRSLGEAVGGVDAAISKSVGHDELQLGPALLAWRDATAIPEESFDAGH
jgi:pyridoxine kinase